MEQLTADKKLETFEDFEKVYDECLNYLREENINIDEEFKSLNEKVPYYESVEEEIEPQTNLPNSNLINKETKVYDKKDSYYADIEEKTNSKAYLHQENIKIDQEINDLDGIDPDYEIIVEKIKPENNSHNGNIHYHQEIIRNHEKNAIYTSKQDEIKLKTYLPKENNPNNEESNALYEKIKPKMIYQVENELKSNDSIDSVLSEARSERLRKLSQQLPKIIITQSNSSLNVRRHDDVKFSELKKTNFASDGKKVNERKESKTSKSKEPNGKKAGNHFNNIKYHPRPKPYGEHPKRLVCKRGVENVALISNVPFERIRLLNDTFHTLINLRWRWIVTGTIVVHFAIWLVFAVFWYIAAYAHYDFEPDPPARTCVTGGHDFLTIFLASVEAQTTIGFGDRAIDEECPESIFLFIMQLILGTGLSGVLTCVVYAKLTRPEKLSRDGVGFSKKAVISVRDGRLCLMMRAWDLNYDHIISSEFTAHFINTYKTKEGEIIRYFAQSLTLQQRQFLLWPVTLVHVIDSTSPLYKLGPDDIANDSYEITLSLKGASASMGTFTQSQTSYLPKEVLWGYRFPPVVKYDLRKRKYVIEQNKLDAFEAVETPFRSAHQMSSDSQTKPHTPHSPHPMHTPTPGTPGSFSEQISSFQLERSSSFRKKGHK